MVSRLPAMIGPSPTYVKLAASTKARNRLLADAKSVRAGQSLDDAAVRTQWRQVAGRIEKPEPFPFVNNHSQVFAGEEQLLDTSFGGRRIDRQEATHGGRQTDGQKCELQDATHREFLHERLQ